MEDAPNWNDRPLTIRAQWILPVDGPPIEGGCIEIHRGRIVSLSRDRPSGRVLDLGAAIVCPQLINAHTHLEFSDLESPLGEHGIQFSDWLRRVIQIRRMEPTNPPTNRKNLAIENGIHESRSCGVAYLGEIATGPLELSPYQHAARECTVFCERLGLSEESIGVTIAQLRSDFSRYQIGPQSPAVGISPHAPYSTHSRLVEKLVDLAVEEKLPVAMHLAESRDELELISRHAGPLRRLLDDLGVWHDGAIPMGSAPLDYLRQLARAPRALIIHGTHLSNSDLDFVARHKGTMSIVYCPRTHAYFGEDPYPLLEIVQRGLTLALGTDSRASNPDLDLRKEIAFAAGNFPGVAPSTWLAATTIGAARALGVDTNFGSIAPGRRAALAAIRMESDLTGDPLEIWRDHIDRLEPLEIRTL